MIRGIRGATTVEANDAGQIADRTRELLRLLVERNGVRPDDIASAIFTVTEDLDAGFPAVAARAIDGWEIVPLLCSREIPVPGSLSRCIRVLLHWNTERRPADIRHAFLRDARSLRPEWGVALETRAGTGAGPS
jgi:chorismate mutase